MMDSTLLIIALGTFLCAVGSTWIVRRFALRLQVTDDQNEQRKRYRRPVPLLGGVAVFVSFAAGIFAAWPYLVGGYLLPKHILGVLVAGGIIVVGGVCDDVKNLRPSRQIIFPVLAALLIIAAGIGIPYMTNPFGGVLSLDQVSVQLFTWHGLPYHLTLFADLFAFAWLLGTMYTTKFLDGLDGLVSGITVIGTVVIAVVSFSSEVTQPETGRIAIIAGSAFLGFVIWNWHPAKIFLGEGGALFAGFILGVLAIISGGKIATAILILGIPILDVAWVILRRLIFERRSPFVGDRAHLHLRLVDSGMSHRKAVLLLYVFTALFGASSLFLRGQEKIAALFLLFVVMLVLALVVVRGYHRKQHE